MTPLKKCTKCGEEKPATREFFGGRNKHKSGLDYYCRACRRKPKPQVKDGYKKCTQCLHEKPATQEYFNKHGANKLRSYCNECQKKIWARHYAENKEKHLKRAREYKKKNKGRCKFLRKQYYEAHKEQEMAARKMWIKLNPDREKIYQEGSRERIREWGKKNRQRRSRTNKALRDRNPEKFRQQRLALYYKNHVKYKERARVHANKRTAELRDGYIIQQIKNQYGITSPTPQLITAKKTGIKAHRLITKLKKKYGTEKTTKAKRSGLRRSSRQANGIT